MEAHTTSEHISSGGEGDEFRGEIRRLLRQRIRGPTGRWRRSRARLRSTGGMDHRSETPGVLGGNIEKSGAGLHQVAIFDRHVSPLTTTICTHPSDEELRNGVRGLRC